MDFAAHATRLSAEADSRLGDLIRYAVNGENGGAFVDMRGRISANETPLGTGFGGLQRRDEMLGGWRLRIAKDLVTKPAMTDRIECAAILDGVYRPMAADPVSDGRYWLVDLQKV